ncbi:MAG: hypothetical protein HY840_01715 [Bacteroidetes bacterium]|nr:hypothetical protein [Bacteroidota bacterium]
MKKRTALLLSLFAFAMILIIGSCKKKDETAAPEQAPTIPPSSTMVMDFNALPSSAKKQSANTPVDSSNLIYAAFNVGVWNLVIGLNMVVPTAAFLESFNHTAVNTGKGTWEWTYSFNAGGTYTAELDANVVGNHVEWKMYISKASVFSDLLWFSGISAIDGKSGNWTLNRKDAIANTVSPFIYIDWTRTSSQLYTTKYTNIIPNDTGNGSYVYYGLTTDTSYNAYYNIFYKNNSNLVEIKWHKTNRNGRVKDALHFNDTNWHCWSTTLANDTLCQ